MIVRKDAIYQTIQASSPEDVHVLALSREAEVYEAASKVADVQAVSLVPMIFGAAISIKKRYEGEPKNVAAAAFGAYSWLKYCVVVDHDVNVYDINDVLGTTVTFRHSTLLKDLLEPSPVQSFREATWT